jgi:hypothetical protein
MLSTRIRMLVMLSLSLPAAALQASEPTPVLPAPAPLTGGAHPDAYAAAGYGAAAGAGRYPVLNAPLYPSPVQYVPAWSGGTIITNQALAPHEMLYPHAYHAMYPPFYYRVRGFWFLTPFGVRQHEQWKLEGTHVKVKYRDHYRPFSQFHPPVSH